MWSSNFTSGYISKKLKAGTQTDIYTPLFIIAWFSIVKRWEESKCPLMDEWISMRYILTMECYPALKGKEIQTYATTWKILEGIMVSAISSHTHTHRSAMWFHLYEILRAVKSIGTENRMLVARDWGEKEWELLCSECRVSFMRMKKSNGTVVMVALPWLY